MQNNMLLSDTYQTRDIISINKTTPVKFLGIFLDETLKCDAHFESVSKTIRNRVFLLRSLHGCVSQATMRKHNLAFFIVYGFMEFLCGGSPPSQRVFGLQRRNICLVWLTRMIFELLYLSWAY